MTNLEKKTFWGKFNKKISAIFVRNEEAHSSKRFIGQGPLPRPALSMGKIRLDIN
jgi:hypothetical protein